ncbi:MAG: hypothetical protein AAF989_05065 [Planctomycetota bacterium]
MPRQQKSSEPAFARVSTRSRKGCSSLAESASNRRTFVAALASLTAGVSISGGKAVAAAPKVVLTEDPSHDLFRVRLAVSAKGNVDVPVNPLVSRDSQSKLPITSDAVLDYEERYRWPEGADPASEPVMGVERYYHEAASESVLNKTEQVFELRPSMRNTLVRRDTLPETIYQADDYFNHEELGLLRTPVSSVELNALLPLKAVAPGDTYQPANEAIGSMLNLSSVDGGSTTVTVESIDDDAAKLTFKGKADGSIDGVATLVRFVGKMTFDRKQNACTWLALGVHETREVGKAEPGFDLSATIRMIRQPIAEPVELPRRAVSMDLSKPIDESRLMVQIRSDRLHLQALVDRRWHLLADNPGSAMLRMIEQESSWGQCNLKPLVQLPAGKKWTIRQLEAEVRQSLKGQLTRFVRSDRSVSPQGVENLQLIAAGKAEGVEVRWIVQHLSDASGRRVLATFTTDARSFDKVAGSEVQFAGTMEFTPIPTQVESSSEKRDSKKEADVATRKNAVVGSSSDRR